MLDTQKRALYYDRVRPVIGEVFEGKSFAAFGTSAFPKVAEALLRSGVLRAFIEEESIIKGGFWVRALGVQCLGRSPVEALDQFSRAHSPVPDGRHHELQAARLACSGPV